MARLQILELPSEHHGDDMITPFALVIDEVEDGEALGDLTKTRQLLGARAILVFEGETVEIPANEPLPTTNTEQAIPPGSTHQMVLDGKPIVWEAAQNGPDEAVGSTTPVRIVGPARQSIHGLVPAKDTSTGQAGELYIGGVQLDAKIREVVHEESGKVTESLREARR